MTRYIIIGNGVAANSAAESIRKSDTRDGITMFSRSPYGFYYTPALPEYLAGEQQVSDFTIHNEQWYQEHNIDLQLQTDVTAIDPSAHTVTAGDRSYDYDKLLLATGGHSFLPPIEGSGSEGVFTMRTIEDADAIKKKAANSKSLLQIGGGLLGLEAANGLRRAGLKVTVVEVFPRLLPRQMDEAGAGILQKQLEQMGFSFVLDAKAKRLRPEGGEIKAELDGGEALSADMCMITAGVRPETGLAEKLGLDIDKGVRVNDRMETGIEHIYAAGDLIEHSGKYYGLWKPAMEQGRVAGAVMAGRQEDYGGTVGSTTLKVVGIELTSAGEIDVDGKLDTRTFTDEENFVYRKIVLKDDRIVGTILLNDIRGNAEILAAMKSKKNVAGFKDELEKDSFDFSKLT